MEKKPKPHVSAALAHLRGGVTWSAIAVVACVIVQLLVFGFVHFTDLRYEAATTAVEHTPDQPLSVVPSIRVHQRPGASAQDPKPEEAAPATAASARKLSSVDAVLHYASDLASALGVASSVVFFAMIFLGTMVAAGGGVPGVEKAVSAATWSLVVALLCLPWQHNVPTAPIPGVFSSYEVMIADTGDVDAQQGSSAALLGIYLVLPTIALVATLLILGRFRAGIAAGIIIQSVSELDRAIEREAEEIARRGISVSGPRAVGALNVAIGAAQGMDGPARAVQGDEPQNGAGPSNRAGEGRPAGPRQRRFQPDDDDDYRRPI